MDRGSPQSDRPAADQAITALFEEEGGRLFSIARNLCGNRQQAEDLVQETFLQAYRKWDTFEGRSRPTTWLYTIASRLCQRLHRKRAGEPARMASLEQLLPFSDRALAVAEAGSGLDDDDEARQRLEAAVTALPDEFRMPLILKDIVGLSGAEVAQVLGLKEATVKTRVHRARLKLREGIAEILPKRELPPAAYERQVCLDLLEAKQEALDRGVAFPVDREVFCARCRAVFGTLDLARDLCRKIAADELPRDLRDRVVSRLQSAGT